MKAECGVYGSISCWNRGIGLKHVYHIYLSLISIVFGLLFWGKPGLAADFTIVTPYWGIEENTLINEDYGLELEDTEPMKGLYIQSIDTKKYQWNLFCYRTNDINYSDLWGFNFTYDRYFGVHDNVKNLIGVGINYSKIDMAGEDVPASRGNLDSFNMDLTNTSYYLRVGRSYDFGRDKLRYSILPWVGGQWDRSEGSGTADFPGPRLAGFQIGEDSESWIAGVNFKATIFHFIQVEAKHSVTYHEDDLFNRSSFMVNFLLSKNVGLSYRYNHQEMPMGEDNYSMIGLTVFF